MKSSLHTLVLFVGIVSFARCQQDILWQNLHSSYPNLDSVEVRLVNMGDSAIYFVKAWPFVTARILRLNERTDQWEDGPGIGMCFTVSEADVPIRLDAGESIEVNLDLYTALDTLDGGVVFRLADFSDTRPLSGSYKLRISYAREPWTLMHRPAEIFTSESPEFSIVQSAGDEQ